MLYHPNHSGLILPCVVYHLTPFSQHFSPTGFILFIYLQLIICPLFFLEHVYLSQGLVLFKAVPSKHLFVGGAQLKGQMPPEVFLLPKD